METKTTVNDFYIYNVAIPIKYIDKLRLWLNWNMSQILYPMILEKQQCRMYNRDTTFNLITTDVLLRISSCMLYKMKNIDDLTRTLLFTGLVQTYNVLYREISEIRVKNLPF